MALEIRDIHKHFGPVRANDGITFTVEPGTIHGLLGENGAGKTTTISMLTGLLTPSDGQVFVDGELFTARANHLKMKKQAFPYLAA